VRWVRHHAARYNVDPERIALLGRSAGGHLALLAAYAPNDPRLPSSCAPEPPVGSGGGSDSRVQAVIGLYAPADLVWGYRHPANPGVIDSSSVLRAFLGGSPETAPQAYDAASPIHHVGPNTPPTLLLHGRMEALVSPLHSERLAERLQTAGVPHQAVFIPYGQHGFDYNFHGWGSQVARPLLLRFLREHLPHEADKEREP
jgi:acetyl esterase/lipase